MHKENNVYLSDEFNKFWQKIENGENFALVRNGDGERSIIMGNPIVAQEGWKAPPYISKLGENLNETLSIVNKNVFFGISCPCCDSAAYYWYKSRIDSKNITFANLWVNANYEHFIKKFNLITRDAILIANYSAIGYKIGNLNILRHYEISDDCISFWKNDAPKMLENIKRDFGKQENILYVVSAGPMSGPIIIDLFKNNPQNCYIDFGSAIDRYYMGVTRPYMIKDNVYAKRNCWMHNPMTTDFNVSVVLNLYKRPENLDLQLNAIKNQTLKPKEILLYQDGTGDSIKIPENLKNKFDFIEINPKNIGVWGRFAFAMNMAKNKYICIFDDDTIPGNRWLENCHTEMLKMEGLYGTIGIILKKPYDYPDHVNKSYYRVGWDGELDFTTEVDFVGHSWFFKKEWLRYLFEAPKEIQMYKLVGEDMSFSYQLLQHGIKTYVPPHPIGNSDLHGSLKKHAYGLGTTKTGISMNANHLKTMKEAIAILLNKKWNILTNKNPKYIIYIDMKKSLEKKQYIKYFFKMLLSTKI
ncbi:MAG: glycosyltransferase [Campylobacteraceae bacterium]|jgi:glycosyltransferase involved in cell wall biosynthesis|nr:glycosyltransferase [Campylobacteraceae bacterium]